MCYQTSLDQRSQKGKAHRYNLSGSRGKFTSKIHSLYNKRCLPLTVRLTFVDAEDFKAYYIMTSLPDQAPRVLQGKKYNAVAIRNYFARYNIQAVISGHANCRI